MIETIKDTIEKTPAELVADIYQRGVLLSGGGAMLRGLPGSDSRRDKNSGLRDRRSSYGRGARTGIVVEDLDRLASSFDSRNKIRPIALNETHYGAQI